MELPKRPVEADHIAKTNLRANLLQWQISRRKKPTGFTHPPFPQPCAGRLAAPLAEQAAKVTLGTPGLSGHNSEILREANVLLNPGDGGSQPRQLVHFRPRPPGCLTQLKQQNVKKLEAQPPVFLS